MVDFCKTYINLLKPSSYFMHHVFNIQKFYMVVTLCLCVVYESQGKKVTSVLHNIKRLVFYNQGGEYLLHGTC
jgi:hypothetical protein